MEFFDKYSYRQKNYALAIICVLLIAVAYKRAFSVSIATNGVKHELEEKLVEAQQANEEIRLKQLQIVKLNQLIGEEGNTVEKVQQAFLNFFAQKAKGISVYEISEVLNYRHPDFTINTHRIVLKGGYLRTLRFLYDFEREFHYAKLLNCTFEYKKYASDDDKSLYATLLIQNYLR